MLHIDLFKRLTFKYRDGWADEDLWDFMGVARATPPRVVREPEGFDDGGDFVHHVTVDKAIERAYTRREVANALGTYFSWSECRHEYDCCGCSFGYALVTPSKRRGRYIVRVRMGYNY